MNSLKQHLFNYLDARQHLWNVYFRERVTDLTECEPLESFQSIDRLLFKSLVCDEEGLEFPRELGLGHDPIRRIVLHPRPSLTNLMLSISDPPKDRNTYWNTEQSFPIKGMEFEFIEFFQWDRYGFQSAAHVRCRIVNFPPDPTAVGRDALIETCYLDFSLRA